MQKSVSRAQAPSGAQGTVEYLVIIAVVVVIGLVVAGLMMAMTGSSTGVSVSSSEIKGKLGVGGISVVDAVAGVDKNGLLVLKNIGSDLVTVNRIVVNDSNHNYSQSIAGGGQASFKLSNIVSCDGANKSYTVIVYYTSANDLNKTANFQTITVDCVPAVSSGNFVQEDKNGGGTNPTYVVTYFGNNNTGGSVPVDSNHYLAGVNVIVLGNTGGLTRTGYSFAGWNTLANGLGTSYAGGNSFSIGSSDVNLFAVWTDITAPVVFLLSPSDGNINSDSATRFDFNATDNATVTSCSLKVNGADVNTKSNPAAVDYFTYSFSGRTDGLYNWGVSCTDGTNTTLTSTRVVNVDLNNYQLSYCQDILDMNLDRNGNYVLMNDINCFNDTHNGGSLYNAGAGFTPIGTSPAFTGTLDGNNKTIIGLYINRPTTGNIGLFGLSSGNISNLGLIDVNIIGQNGTGALVGDNNGGTITNSYSTGHVTGNQNVGGLVGANWPSGNITNSHSSASVYGDSMIGGLAGSHYVGTISGSYTTGDVNGANQYIGGLVGYEVTGTVSNSYSTGPTYGYYAVGGLVGQLENHPNPRPILTNSYSTGIVIGHPSPINSPSQYLGGVVGFSGGVVYNSYATGDVNGSYDLGGFVGGQTAGTIADSYSTGNTNASGSREGGFIGQQLAGTITNSYSTGRVTGPNFIGGFLGNSAGTITNCGWWNLAGPARAIGNPAGDITYSEANKSAFYDITHHVYDATAPTWTFGANGTDKNWSNICSTTYGYPRLMWEGITSTTNCRT